MGFLSKLFSSDDAAGKVVDQLANGLDKLVYTDEEKADAAAAERQAAFDSLLKWMDASQGQNLARRFLAVSLAMMWGTIYGVQIILSAIAPWVAAETSTRLMASAAVLGESAAQLNGAMMLILAFYFAAPHIGDIVKPAMNRFFNGNKKAPE